MPDTLTPEQMRIVRAARAVVYEIEQGTGEPDDEQWAELRAAHIDAMAEAVRSAAWKDGYGVEVIELSAALAILLGTLAERAADVYSRGGALGLAIDEPDPTAADAWAEVKSAIGEGFVVTVTLNTLGTYVAAAWPGGNYVGDPAYLTDRPEATADAALRALALAILRGTPQ
jgi:hypothetical protein